MVDYPDVVSGRHRDALNWFRDAAGQTVPWPEPLNGMFLLNKAKGIHKPAGLDYALSVRHSLSGPYQDVISLGEDGHGWTMRYAHEGLDQDYFTNRALRRCMVKQVPVGVIVQEQSKPSARYRILGLGLVISEADRAFTIRQADSGLLGLDITLDVALPPGDFDAANLKDARERVLRTIARRRGQPAFRKELMRAYAARCAISGCSVAAVLEAAHIIPYLGDHTNNVANGLLLRTDLHTLFDLGLLAVSPASHQVLVHSCLSGTEFETFSGKKILLPASKVDWPSDDALASRPLAEQ